jgi:hypothetical protein
MSTKMNRYTGLSPFADRTGLESATFNPLEVVASAKPFLFPGKGQPYNLKEKKISGK